MPTGRVKTIIEPKGFGFIDVDGEHPFDVFFHIRDLVDLDFDGTLVERRVAFNVEDTAKGKRARNVRPII